MLTRDKNGLNSAYMSRTQWEAGARCARRTKQTHCVRRVMCSYVSRNSATVSAVFILTGKAYCVTTDNFYLSSDLFDLLIHQKTDACGTARSSRLYETSRLHATSWSDAHTGWPFFHKIISYRIVLEFPTEISDGSESSDEVTMMMMVVVQWMEMMMIKKMMSTQLTPWPLKTS